VHVDETQLIQWAGRTFILSNVRASLVEFNSEEVLKVERDLSALPFDADNLVQTVDEPTFVKLKDLDIESGVIEVKVLSRIKVPSLSLQAPGFYMVWTFGSMMITLPLNRSTFDPIAGRSEYQFVRITPCSILPTLITNLPAFERNRGACMRLTQTLVWMNG
jgi:hypothetical protein